MTGTKNVLEGAKTISIKDIIDVTEDGILYKDGTGSTAKVLFIQCRQNWVDHVNQGGFMDWQGNPAKTTLEQSKYIGERNMSAKPPYLLLYSDKKLKIEMHPEERDDLTDVQRDFFRMLYEVGGVSTFDMT